jgi:hypothetical protein
MTLLRRNQNSMSQEIPSVLWAPSMDLEPRIKISGLDLRNPPPPKKKLCFCSKTLLSSCKSLFNHLTPNGHFSGRTAPLTSRRCILYIYSTDIRTEYFKPAAHSPFFFSSSKCRLFHNATFFGSCIIHILYTGCATI